MLLKVILFLSVEFYRSTPSTIWTHYYVSLQMNWTDAQQYCRLNFYDLSTISSQDENDMFSLTNFAKYNCNNWLNDPACRHWIGLHRNSTNLTDWNWSRGGKAQFSMWANKEPRDSETAKCAYYNSVKAKWYADSCSLSLTFFCMDVSSQLVLVPSNNTWEKALDYCRTYHTDLATLGSADENALAATMSQAADTTHVWIGLHFVVRYWIWMNGSALEYQAWSAGTPPKCPGRNNSCGALETQGKVWKPRDCMEKLNFLCYSKLKK